MSPGRECALNRLKSAIEIIVQVSFNFFEKIFLVHLSHYAPLSCSLTQQGGRGDTAAFSGRGIFHNELTMFVFKLGNETTRNTTT